MLRKNTEEHVPCFNEILMTFVNLFQILNNISWLPDTIWHVMEENCSVYTVLEWDINGNLKFDKLDWSWYTCLTRLYGGTDMYNLLHKEQLHVSALFIGNLEVDKWETLVSSYTRLVWVVYSGEFRGGVGMRSRMCCVGRVVWVHGFCCILF